MKNLTKMTRTVSLFLAGSVLFASCASTTTILSTPAGAKLYLNGEPAGSTPYTHRDTKIVGATTSVRLEKEGYETLNTSFSRDEKADVGAIIGGVFFLFPFLWTMKYKPTHTFEMVPVSGTQVSAPSTIQQTEKSKSDKLRELKQLFDDKLISQAEYEKEKQKILAE